MVFELLGEASVVQIIAVLLISSILVVLIRQRYFLPVSKIPGPFFASFGTCWQLWHVFKGRIEEATYDLHLKHGKSFVHHYNGPLEAIYNTRCQVPLFGSAITKSALIIRMPYQRYWPHQFARALSMSHSPSRISLTIT